MLRSYLIIALRSVRRHPFYALMNVIGLAVGLAACILILLYIHHERSFDTMYSASERTYRVVEARRTPGESEQDFVYTMGPLAEELERSIPEVTEAVRAISGWSTGRRVVERGDIRFYVGDHLFVEPEFFEVFDFPFTMGSRSGALDEPFEVVLTEESARRYFGSEDPVGETISVEDMGDFTVTGVVKLPANTHFYHSIFFSFETLSIWEGFWEWVNDWTSDGTMTYVVLEPGTDARRVEEKMRAMVAERADEEVAVQRTPYLQALTDIHLGSTHIEFDENRSPGRAIYLYLFGAVAAFVVLIAAINYMNMATARSLRRAREIGLRKVVGAQRGQLVAQFLSESILTSVLALVFGLGLVRAVLPLFNQITDKAITFDFSAPGPLFLGIAAITIAVGLIAGSYPAFQLSRFRPGVVLRGSSGTDPGEPAVRKSLVVVQFVMSIALIIATLVVGNQLEYIQTKQLGFEQEQLVVVDINDGNTRSKFETVKDEFARVPGVRAVSASNNVPGDWKNIPQVEAGVAGREDLMTAHFLGVDENFLETYQMNLLEGRAFGTDFGMDSTSVLLNQTAARLLSAGLGDRIQVPEDAYVATIVGIVEDFHFQSLHQPIGPLVIGFHSNSDRLNRLLHG